MSPECRTIVFYGELEVGKRYRGGKKKFYKNTLKASLRILTYRQQTAQYRAKWRIRKGADYYEAKRVCKAEQKRKEHKAKGSRVVGQLTRPGF